MQLWKDLTTAALLGTNRQVTHVESAPGALGMLFDALDTDDPEQNLLDRVAATVVFRRAGAAPRRDERSLDKPCPKESLRAINPRIESDLGQMLGGSFKEVLPLALRRLAERGLRVSETLLPRLLEHGRQNSPIGPLLPSIIGERGRWLAAQNPEWRYVEFAVDDPTVWDEGRPNQRVEYLRRLRQRDPAIGRDLLRDAWSAEKADIRAALLSGLSVGLSDEDEAFLEPALDDRAKEVRRGAADLLIRVPGSRFAARMVSRIEPLLELKRNLLTGDSLMVTLPSECDTAMQRDGIEPKPPQGVGERSWWLSQMLGSVDPGYWSEHWNLSADSLLSASRDKALAKGWATAARRTENAEWLLALVRRSFVSGEMKDLQSDLLPALSCIPPSSLESLIIGLLQEAGHPVSFHDGHAAGSLLQAHNAAWSDELSRAVVASLRSRIEEERTQHQTIWTVRSNFRGYALRIGAHLYPEFEHGWPTDAPDWTEWSSVVEQFLDILRFRHELEKEIDR